eukprot:scaffold193805_cov30-Tisochrysis_lutea.AAC.2
MCHPLSGGRCLARRFRLCPGYGVGARGRASDSAVSSERCVAPISLPPRWSGRVVRGRVCTGEQLWGRVLPARPRDGRGEGGPVEKI